MNLLVSIIEFLIKKSFTIKNDGGKISIHSRFKIITLINQPNRDTNITFKNTWSSIKKNSPSMSLLHLLHPYFFLPVFLGSTRNFIQFARSCWQRSFSNKTLLDSNPCLRFSQPPIHIKFESRTRFRFQTRLHQHALHVAIIVPYLAPATSMDHGYAVDVTHLLFTADSRDTQRHQCLLHRRTMEIAEGNNRDSLSLSLSVRARVLELG